MNKTDTPEKVASTDELGQLPKPAGFSAGTHNGAMFTVSRRTGKNFAKGGRLPLCEWYSAEQMRLAFAAGVLAERNKCRYPECVNNTDERCSRWLTGDCPGPDAGGEPGTSDPVLT